MSPRGFVSTLEFTTPPGRMLLHPIHPTSHHTVSIFLICLSARHRLILPDKLLTAAHGRITGHASITTSHHPPTAALSHLVPPESRYHSGIHRPARPCPLMHKTQIAPNANQPSIEMGMSTLTILSGL
ncbi:hypothetical protein E4U43_002497 [Claviceps pusilla]|uniref:Uncharacterized protein n=1 Tax=Claviceps pusilla TaxID=123648 RepID=A0A9P7T3C4_9HYPO|nr:hypothetical protein E4U43_002497 [Claviceps pusilla]